MTFYEMQRDNHINPKAKIFFGNAGGTRADQLFGEWMEEHPHAVIIDFKYEQVRYGDHSIVILYEEKDE